MSVARPAHLPEPPVLGRTVAALCAGPAASGEI